LDWRWRAARVAPVSPVLSGTTSGTLIFIRLAFPHFDEHRLDTGTVIFVQLPFPHYDQRLDARTA
jgi:hypothetical protein